MIALFDTECYPNYWLLKIRPVGGKSSAYRLREGQSFSNEQKTIIQNWFSQCQVISFNGIRYDVPMITAALMGYTPEQLKLLNDKMIVHKFKHWELGLPGWAPKDHIDIMEVIPLKGPMKYRAACIHSKTIRDLPYPADTWLTDAQMNDVFDYCETDLDDLLDLFNAIQPQIEIRKSMSEKYGMDLRSKSDAQIAENVLKSRCEAKLGRSISKSDFDWNLSFKYEPPAYLAFQSPVLQHAFQVIKDSIFRLSAGGKIELPPQIEELPLQIGVTEYQLGIGGIHSKEKHVSHYSDENFILRDHDVARYYPQLIINSKRFPLALGESFTIEFTDIADNRLFAKRLCKRLEKEGITTTIEYSKAKTEDEVGKIMINGTFGKTLSAHSILFAPQMGIQTTVTGQLSILMLIEWHEHYGIHIISANTDGIVVKCPRDQIHISDFLIKEWESRTGLEMETTEYSSIHSASVNAYIAIKADGKVKRKGEYAQSNLILKKAPGEEICSDAVVEYLTKGTPLLYTIVECRDIRKFITVANVDKGGTKLWGVGPLKGTKVRDMLTTLAQNGWVKDGRNWRKGDMVAKAGDAYNSCFEPQRPEYLGKVVRWYYSTNAPGPIVRPNGNLVPDSLNAKPCMTLPDSFPDDIDYEWYYQKCLKILVDIGK